MSNYSLQVDNSRNYDPTLRNTLQAYADAQEQDMRTAEAAYGEMSAKANMLEKLANDVKGKDSVAYQNYMNYANTLRQQTDLLATQGLNPSIWKNIIQAKNDYSRIIHPIEEAYQAREKEAQRQAEYMKQHPGAVFERNAYNMGIDQWMKNPHYTAQVIDKETIANRAKERFAALKTQLMEFVSQNGGLDAIMTKNPDAVKRWFKTKAPWLYESMYKTGANPEDVKKLLAGDPEMENSMLQGIVNDTVRMSGIDSWNTDYDHYTAEQNAQNRQNLFDQIYTSVRGEAPSAIGETKFDKYEDKISADLMMEKARLAETIRHNKAIEDAAGNKGKGSAIDKWKHYWQNAGSTADTEEEIAEPTSQYNIRAFIKAQPDLAKTLSRDDWNNIMKEIAKENQLSSPSAVTVDKYMNQIIDKAAKIKQEHIEEYNTVANHKPGTSSPYGRAARGTYHQTTDYDKNGERKDGKSIVTEHEDYMKNNVRTLYANKKSPGVGEADEDEVLANMTKGNNKTFVTSNLGPEDIKNDIAPLANMIAGDKSKKINLNLFLNEDGVPYKGDKWLSNKDQEGFIDEILGLANGTIKNGQWSKSYDFDTKGRAQIRLNVNGKETFVSPEIIGIPGGTKYARKMLDILTESEKILRSKTTTVAAKAAAETRKTAAQAGLGYILGADKDWHTKPDANGYDGDKKFIEEELATGLNELFPKMINN